MGIYKSIGEVPYRKRLDRYKDEYEGSDIWNEFERDRIDRFDSEHYRDTFHKTDRSWKGHMATQGRHHALATPDDVSRWCAELIVDRKLETVYTQYWVRLEEFYSWLQSHRHHPHVYHPVLMAAANHEVPRAIWWVKMDENPAALVGLSRE